jgi:uncharacterized 2Fe-2S/4Fe-4S cluster protein (DUF4445 family)
MAVHTVKFDIVETPCQVPTGTLISEAAHLAGVEIGQPCGGQGRCGRCTVQVLSGTVRRRSALRLSNEDIEAGFALACQTVIEGDVSILIPPQEKIERRLTTDRVAAEVTPPFGYNPDLDQTMRRVVLRMQPPHLDDQTDDLSRLLTAFRQQSGLTQIDVSISTLRQLGNTLRLADWEVTTVVEILGSPISGQLKERMVAILPRLVFEDEPLWGIAVDIGTTTVTLWLVDLMTGEVYAQVAEYNGQIARGEDVISRIIYSSKDGGLQEMQTRVLETINTLVEQACKRANADPTEIIKACVAGNSTMAHLFLAIPAAQIRLSPFITVANHMPPIRASEIGLHIHPEATVDCLPGVASYVGADISAGVYASGMDDTEKLSLFIDIGTNGEIVLGDREWLMTCACSAGPAFEGAGVLHGMRATRGAIEEVWVASSNSPHPYEPTYRVIGGGKARGICGSGLISTLAELFITGVVDKAGHINLNLSTINPRIRSGEHGAEYVIAWAPETDQGQEVVITDVDIDNLKRAKAAIYAGFKILAESASVPLELVEQFLIGGSFGKYINVEKAIQIGLLPDISWDRFQFLGNTSIRGAYFALLDWKAREKIADIASRMTYIELSSDNSFFEAFTSALFFPHTDLASFPSVEAVFNPERQQENINQI